MPCTTAPPSHCTGAVTTSTTSAKGNKAFCGHVAAGLPSLRSVILMGGNHTHRADWFSLYPFMDTIEAAYVGKGDTHIGDGAWIGMRAMIMPGVNIGEGAIIAANSVVTKDVAPYCVVAGSPAKQLKTRFEPEVIAQLLQLNIYDWPTEKFQALQPYLSQGNLEVLLAQEQQYAAEQDGQLGK